MRRIGPGILLLALCLSVGVPLAACQSLAWVRMYLSFSKEHSVVEAVCMTFDGQNPCEICEAVDRAASGHESHKDAPPVLKVAWIFIELECVKIFVEPDQVPRCDDAQPLLLRSEAPPSPPPECVLRAGRLA